MVGDAGLIRDEVVLRVELGGGGTRSPKENGDRNAGQEMRPHGLAPFSLRGPRRRSRSRPAAPLAARDHTTRRSAAKRRKVGIERSLDPDDSFPSCTAEGQNCRSGGSWRQSSRIAPDAQSERSPDRKSTRLNSSHGYISYAV